MQFGICLAPFIAQRMAFIPNDRQSGSDIQATFKLAYSWEKQLAFGPRLVPISVCWRLLVHAESRALLFRLNILSTSVCVVLTDPAL